MKRLPFLICLFVILCFAACRQTDAVRLLRMADGQVGVSSDSVRSLLMQIEKPSQLSGEDRLLYGWLWAYVHYIWNSSMVEDTLVVRAADNYIARRDTAHLLLSYLLKAKYLYWIDRNEHSVALLDTGLAEALALRDTNKAVDMLGMQANQYTYVWKDYPRTVNAYRRALQLKETAGLCFSQGLAMGLMHGDSADYYLNRSVELGLQDKDTVSVIHFLRNYAQYQSYLGNDNAGAIATVHRLNALLGEKHHFQRSMGYTVLVESFLKEGQLDSAQYYLDKSRALAMPNGKFVTSENMFATYQALIDYSRRRTFDILGVARYNDSIWNALSAMQSTLGSKEESKESLSQANLLLVIERQRMQLTLSLCLLALVLVGGGAFLYIRNRRYRLIDAEERIEALNHLLEEATTRGENPAPDEAGTDGETVNGQFFRKILLQQLGIIRLVATQPTSQNQDLLRRMSGISNHEVPVDSLLVWEDLYPVIDRVYDGFYTKMNRRFGNLLIDKEQQLCCLLCAGFSTKEISVVTQQSIPTIYQRKTNIRKKLGVGEKEDIVEFIELQATSYE